MTSPSCWFRGSLSASHLALQPPQETMKMADLVGIQPIDELL